MTEIAQMQMLTNDQQVHMMQLGGVLVVATPLLIQIAKRWIPKEWRSALPLVIGALAGVTLCLQSGMVPWSVDGFMAVMAGMGGSATGHSIYEIKARGPKRKAKAPAAPKPKGGDGD